MSIGYENYTHTSKSYDLGRIPVGASDALSLAESLFGPKLPTISILEAGCGTGNFLQFFQPHVGHLTGFDLNEGMLGRAKEKLAGCQNVKLVQGSLLEKLPFQSGSFELVMINQVLHHLVTEKKFGSLKPLMAEFHRVLNSDGLLIINHCFPKQGIGVWYEIIIPAAFRRWETRAIPREDLEKLLFQVGFQNIQVKLVSDLFMPREIYEDFEGPTKNWWRDLDSVWALATEDELQLGLEKYSALSQQQKWEFFNQKEKMRKELGSLSIISAIKTN